MRKPDYVTTSLANKNFLRIVDESGITFYGGHQSWFERFTQNFGGCGPTAAANIVAYMAMNISELSNLYGYNKVNMSKVDFSKLMENVYSYVTPLELPIWNHFSDKKGSQVGIPSLGIISLSKFAMGVERYAHSKGIDLKAIRFKEKLNFVNAVNYIKKGLDKDSPVALLNMLHKVEVQWISPLTGDSKARDIQRHWVTITGLTENKKSGEVTLEASTWGGKATLSLNELIDQDWRSKLVSGGMVYFEIASS